MYYLLLINVLLTIIPGSTFPGERESKGMNEIESISKGYLMGHYNPRSHPQFVSIDRFSPVKGLYLRKEAYEAFENMYVAAMKDNIKLSILSATRSFDVQKYIWESKWTGKRMIENGNRADIVYAEPYERALKILNYSAMPGTSRHHWGTEVDINYMNNSYFEEGYGLKVYEWLKQNAHKFGFCQPYSEKGKYRPYGHNEEKWHWSYVPLSRLFTQAADESIQDNDIKGFLGAEFAEEIGVVEKYMLGLSADCFTYWK